jgi:hypothetical protein
MLRIFYSWQADTPGKIGHYLVRDALQLALDQLAEDLALDEAERPELDHDTKGVPGAPSIADTILEKIDACDVFVADVTLTGRTESGKPLINSNVAIELGYALKAKGDGSLILVMNDAHGSPDSLPFDLRHRRWPTIFSVAPDAARKDRNATRDELAKKLRPVLQSYIGAAKQSAEPAQEVPATVSPAHYWQPEEVLVLPDEKNGMTELRCGNPTLLFLRVWPRTMLPQLPEHETMALLWGSRVWALNDRLGNFSPARNRYGSIAYGLDRQRAQILSATQLFRSREIWGFDATCLADTTVGSSGEELHIIPSVAYEKMLAGALHRYLTLARDSLDYTEGAIVEAGASNVEGFHMAVNLQQFGKRLLGPVHRQHIVKRAILADWSGERIDSVLLSIFEEFFDAVGARRPSNFAGFPGKS